MLNYSHCARIGVVFCALFLARCTLVDEKGPKVTNTGLIVTPVSSYSTFKARNLAQKYKDNLERIVVEVVRNPTAGKVQFANNIASAGGVGFFAHSASAAVDERYLELIVAVPDVFDVAMGLSSKIDRLLSEYGSELLVILLKDAAIYGDPEVAGYGLNFSWRSLLQNPGGSQVIFERSVLYFKKDEARKFLDHKVAKEAFLSGAVIFAMRGDAPPQQVAYANRESGPVAGATAREETVSESTIAALKPGVTEKDISEKDGVTGGNEPLTTPKSTARKEAEETQAARDDTKKQPEAGAQGKKGPEVSGNPAGSAVKAESLPVKGGAGQSPAATSGPENSVTASVNRGSEPQDGKPDSGRVAESSAMPTDGPTKIERAQEVEKRDLRAAQPPAPAHETAGAPEKPKQAQVSQAPEAAPSRPTVASNKQKAMTDKVTAQKGNEAKEKLALTPDPTSPAKPVEPAAKPEGFQIAGKETSQDLQPPSPKPTSGGLPAPRQIEKPSTPALVNPAGVVNKPESVVVVKAQETKEVKKESVQTAEPARVTRPVEQPEDKIAARQAEPIQEARLRKDLPQAVTGQKAGSTAPKPERAQSAKETPAVPAGEQGGDRAKENRDGGLSARSIETAKPAAQAKPAETTTGVRLALKSVEGYAVQLSFPQKIDAQRWSETLSREGYTTSITSIGETDAVRLRVGSFSSPDAAKTLLGRLQKEGLTGFVIQVPKG